MKARFCCTIVFSWAIFSGFAVGDHLLIQNGDKFQCGPWGCAKIYIDSLGRFYFNFSGTTYYPFKNIVDSILAQPDYQDQHLPAHKQRARSFYWPKTKNDSPAPTDGPNVTARRADPASRKVHNSARPMPSQQRSTARPTPYEAPASCGGKAEDVTLEGTLLGAAASTSPQRVAYRFATSTGEIIADTIYNPARIGRLNALVGQRVVIDRGRYFEQRRTDGSCLRTVQIGEAYSQENVAPSGAYSEVAGPGFDQLPRPDLTLGHYCKLKCAPFTYYPKFCRIVGLPGLTGIIGTGENSCQALKDLCQKTNAGDSSSSASTHQSYACRDRT